MSGKHRQRKRWYLWRWEHITDRTHPEAGVYLTRLRVFNTPWTSLYVHWIRRPDQVDPHDHPWSFWSLILKGGYREEWIYPETPYVPALSRFRVRWSLARTGLDVAHRITWVLPGTVTLVLTGRRVREWGFYLPNGDFIPWQLYDASSHQR